MLLRRRSVRRGCYCVRPHPLRIGEVPTASESFVELDNHDAAIQLGLSQRIFGWEKQLLRVQHFEVSSW